MKIVWLSGECDFSAEDMVDSGELDFLVNKMLKEKSDKIESSDGSMVYILEFGEVDRRFVIFVRDYISDYDLAKQSDFFILDEEGNTRYV